MDKQIHFVFEIINISSNYNSMVAERLDKYSKMRGGVGGKWEISIYLHKEIDCGSNILYMHKMASAGELFLAFENRFSAPSSQSAPGPF